MKSLIKIMMVVMVSSIYQPSLFAQTTPLETRLKARKINDYLVLRYDPLTGTMKYETDPLSQNKSKQHTLDKEPPTEFVSMSNKTNVDIAFLNPFKYQIKVNTEFAEDPIYKNISEYTNRVSDILTTVTGESVSIEKKIIDSKNIEAKFAGTGEVLNKLVEDNKLLGTSSWYAWYLQMQSYFSPDRFVDETSTLFSLVKDVLTLTNKSYSILIDTARNERKINRIILSYNKLPEIMEYKLLIDSMKHIQRAITAYEKELTKITLPLAGLRNVTQKTADLSQNLSIRRATSQEIISKSTEIFSTFNRAFIDFSKASDDYMLVNYTQIVTTEYINELESEIERQTKLLTAIKTALEEVERLAFDPERNAFILSEVGVYPMHTSNVNVQVSTKDEKGKETTISQSMRISEYSMIVPEFSLGMAFTNIKYNTYGLQAPAVGDTTFTVSSAVNHINNYALLGMLNLIPVIGRSNFYPVIQLGAGITGVNNTLPLLGVGTGIRIFQPTDLSITFGALWHWEKKLQALTPGAKVGSTDELTNDLEMKFVPKADFYLGIQYHF